MWEHLIFQNCPPLSCGCGLYRPIRLKCWPWYKKGLICVCLSRIKYHWKHIRTHVRVSHFSKLSPLSCGCGLYRPIRLKCWPWYKKGLICVCLSRIKYHWKHVRTHVRASHFFKIAHHFHVDAAYIGLYV